MFTSKLSAKYARAVKHAWYVEHLTWPYYSEPEELALGDPNRESLRFFITCDAANLAT